jgi:hypothetical protein
VDAEKAAANLGKHGVAFEEAVTVFLDLDYLLVRARAKPTVSSQSGCPAWQGSSSSCTANEERSFGSSARVAPLAASVKPMSEEENQTEPSEESLSEIPERDFSGAIRPNRYANLRGTFQHAVFVDPEVWAHFGSAERILEALRLLVDIAKKRPA